MTPTTPTAPGVSVEEKISALMTLVDLHGAQRWNTGCYEQSGEKRLAKLADKQAVEARNKLETILRTALLASAAGGGETKPWGEVRLDKSGELAIFTPNFNAKLAIFTRGSGGQFSEGDKLYTAPPPPVGELQGVSDADEIANACYRDLLTTGYNGGMGGQTWDRALVRAALAASRPVAVGVSANSIPSQKLWDIIAAVPDIGDKVAREWAIAKSAFLLGATPPSAALTPVVAAPQAAVDAEKIMEQIARQWDGCLCDIAAVGEVDIGEAIRSDWKEYSRLATGEGKTS